MGVSSCICSQREIQRGDEVAWYADGDTTVRSELNPSTAYAFGTLTTFRLCMLTDLKDRTFGKYKSIECVFYLGRDRINVRVLSGI